jgi:hypothetical protein
MSSISVVNCLHSSAALWNWLPGNQDGKKRRRGRELTILAPGNMELVISVIALSALSKNGSSLGALSYPYTVAIMTEAAKLLDCIS